MKNERHEVSQLIYSLIVPMVSERNKLRVVDEVEDESKVLHIYVIPAQTDYRIICGKKGRMINSLAFIAKLAGQKFGTDCELHLEESFKGEIAPDGEFEQNPQVNCEMIVRIVANLADLLIGAKDTTHERSNDLLTIRIAIDESVPEQAAALASISDIAYTIGYKQGIIVKVSKQKAIEAV